MIDRASFRRLMGRFATGVTVVTSRDEAGEPVGLTVNAFTSVSLDPTLVLVCIHENAGPHDAILGAGRFAVNVLGRHQRALALRFAEEESETRFRGLETRSGPGGSPLLGGCLAWLECEIRDVFTGGDHSVVIGEVLHGAFGDEGSPLLFYRGELREDFLA